MKFQININKTNIVILMILLSVTTFGIAQVPPNPGHSFSQLYGVAPNCLQATCPELPGTWGSEAVTSKYSARSYTSDNLWNGNYQNPQYYGLSSFCRSDGTNCAYDDCPAGMSKVGDFCIDTDVRGGSGNGQGYMDTLSTSGCGADPQGHLCSVREWVAGCLVYGAGPNWGIDQWVGDAYLDNNVLVANVYGSGCLFQRVSTQGTTSFGNGNPAYPKYRCCKNLA